MKNILAVFNCLVKVRYPNEEYHTEDDRYWMQSHQDLFETLEEAEKYISGIFDDVYEGINSDDPEECPYDLVNDEYDIYIKILNDKFNSARYDSGSVDMLWFDHDIRANSEYLKYVDYVEYRYDFKTRKSKRYENVYGCEPIRRDIGDATKTAEFKDGDIVKFKGSDKLYAVSAAPSKESLNRTVWSLLYAVVPYELNKEMDLGLEVDSIHQSELELVSRDKKRLHIDIHKYSYIITEEDVEQGNR